MVQNKNLKKNNGYDIIPSHVSKCVNNQRHGMMVGEAETGVLKFNQKVYTSDKFDLATSGSMSEVQLRYAPIRN